MAMKLQWLPEPDSRGGFQKEHSEGITYCGFDRFGFIRAHVTHEGYIWDANIPYLPGEKWEQHRERSTRPDAKSAMLLAESVIEDDGDGCS